MIPFYISLSLFIRYFRGDSATEVRSDAVREDRAPDSFPAASPGFLSSFLLALGIPVHDLALSALLRLFSYDPRRTAPHLVSNSSLIVNTAVVCMITTVPVPNPSVAEP